MRINLVGQAEGGYTTGISNYTSNLYKCLDSEKFQINLINDEQKVGIIIKNLFRVFGFDIEAILKDAHLFLKLPKRGLIHFTNQSQIFPLLYQKRKSIVTVHDILPIINKDYGWMQRVFYRIIFGGLKRADILIADSNFTRECLVKSLGIYPEKIRVIPLGVDCSQFKVLKKVKKKKSRVLYVGSEMPRKNLAKLLYAFAELKKRVPDAKLVKIGLPQWNTRGGLLKLCKKLDIRDSIIFKNYVDDIVKEYNKASLFVFPSLYEGFGLPVLEAMACGCPVICSDKTSLPEVAGDAALYFDGYDHTALTEKMLNILTNKKLRNSLIKKGLARAKLFNWEICAKKTIQIYQHLD